MFLHFYVFLYNKLQLFLYLMYILPHLCVAKDFRSFLILDQFWTVLLFLNFYNSTYFKVWVFFSFG
jgi:hypothetical protein